jgi:hypothetical protein
MRKELFWKYVAKRMLVLMLPEIRVCSAWVSIHEDGLPSILLFGWVQNAD